MSGDIRRLFLLAVVFLTMVPAAATAQGAIAGAVRDTTGAVLPGVTVEASSPALIEKVRTVVTDGQGRYRIIDLRPGTYAVTFSLPGFRTVSQQGIELAGTFTATVNAEMAVGALEETVTVSGASPLVDVQNVVQERVMTAEVIAALPTARTFQTIGAVIPGLTTTSGVGVSNQDVGGSMGDQSQNLAIHGGRPGDQQNMIDGFYHTGLSSTSQNGIFNDVGSMQEMRYELSAIGADTTTGGVHVNFIPKDGGNRFSGNIFATYTNHALQSDNTTSELLARGLGAINSLDKIWDFNGGLGGPIRRDKLWFYASGRVWGTNNRVAGMWYDTDPFDNVFTPDLSRQAIEDSKLFSGSLRLTWQLNSKNKLALYHLNQQGRCLCHRDISSSKSPEASKRARSPVMHAEMIVWNAPLTNRLLIEAGGLVYTQVYSVEPQLEVWRRDDILALTELSTGLNFRVSDTGHNGIEIHKFHPRASLSYVTGSHALKVGMSLERGGVRSFQSINGDITLQLLNGVPRSVTVFATPWDVFTNLDALLGIYAQDQWTLNRLTVNAGIRWDYHEASVPEQHLPAVRFMGARDFAAIPDVPKWTDLNPRLGAAYDLFGNSKTAVKASLSRYVIGKGTEVASQNNPVNTSVNSASRTWTDLNGDFRPDCNFVNPAANQECGALSPANFGQLRITTRFDDAIRTGFGVREDNWETSVGVQHELSPGVSVEASYYGRWYGNFTVTDNLAVTPANFDPYCITAPVDSRLPGGGGYQVCGLYDVNPSQFGQVNNLVTVASNYGKQWEHYSGADFLMNARLPGGGRFGGGMNIGRSVTNRCFVVDSPQELQFCDVKPPFQPNVRGYAIYPLPWWDVQASATFQSIPGPQITASYVVPNAVIAPSLGRSLAAGANGTATIQLVQPGTMYGDRLYQLDVRLTKVLRMGTRRLQGNFDLYNMLNASPVLRHNNTFGPAWQRPIAVLPGRLLKFSVQVDF